MHNLSMGGQLLVSGPAGGDSVVPQAPSLCFLTAGIGITPAVARLDALQHDLRPMRFVHIARRAELALWEEIQRFAAARSNVRVELFLSDVGGRHDLGAVVQGLAKAQAQVLVCGPANFAREAQVALEKEGVPSARIVCETFVSANVPVEMRTPTTWGPHGVRFADAGLGTVWTLQDGTLLDLAERHGLVLPAHCRAGICGTCRVHLLSGRVERLAGPDAHQGFTLACCSAPMIVRVPV